MRAPVGINTILLRSPMVQIGAASYVLLAGLCIANAEPPGKPDCRAMSSPLHMNDYDDNPPPPPGMPPGVLQNASIGKRKLCVHF